VGQSFPTVAATLGEPDDGEPEVVVFDAFAQPAAKGTAASVSATAMRRRSCSVRFLREVAYPAIRSSAVAHTTVSFEHSLGQRIGMQEFSPELSF
jgi:hypothetical protein